MKSFFALLLVFTALGCGVKATSDQRSGPDGGLPGFEPSEKLEGASSDFLGD